MRTTTWLASMAIIIGSLSLTGTAFAQGRTEASSDQIKGVFDSPVTLALDAGVLSFQQPGSVGGAVDNLSRDNRFAGGLRFDWDFTNSPQHVNPIHFGMGTGVYYSRLNLGTASSVGNNGGSNFFLVPLNLQIGFTAAGNIHLAAYGGANGVFRSDDNSLNLGRSSAGGSSFQVFPAVGLNLGIGFGRGLGLELHGDYTFTPGTDLILATAGLVFPLV